MCNCAINTFAVGLIQAVRAKIGFSHMVCTGITPALKVLENCSNAQKTWQFFQFAMRKNFLVLGFGFFVSDVISVEYF